MLHNHGSVHSSPTSASLIYHGSPSMAQPHLPHSPYQAPLEGHHGYSRAMSPSPHMAHVDPYRSAYSQQQLYQHQQQQPYSSYQTHLASHGSSPMMHYDDLSSSYDSRCSGSQSNQFPMYPLSPQNSNQALTAAYHHQQPLHQARRDSSIDLAGVVGRSNSRQSMTLLTPQPMRAGSGSKTTSSSTASRRLQSEEEEEEENAEILQKVSQSGTHSGMTLASSRPTGKNSKKFKRGTNEPKSDIDDDDEEEGQEKGANRQRDGKRCWCCSRRLCVYMSFLFLLILAVAMFFVLPRSPGISFVAVVPDGDPVFSRGRIQESFTLQMRVDSSENYLPIKLTSVEMTVWWKMDMTKIGTNEGLPSSVTIHPKVVQTISMPMAFDYQSLRIDTSTDGVLQALIKACTPLPPGSTTPPDQLNLTFGGKMKVWGLSWAWKPEFSFNVGTACPSNVKEQAMALPPPSPTTPTGATSSTGMGSSPATPSGTRGTTPSGGNSVAAPTPSARS
ncbi:hypothetical protein BG006_001281 [Podila minutissima]|uniref:Uncharacterized protein n=1 Tax=Podila minutissima TaxID=64525 RepID=A0A9P5SD94_9FUNG|nr:hypothetical protein BG006_001281 [Podila minutissima]